MKLVDRIVAGGDQALGGVRAGLVFRHDALEGLEEERTRGLGPFAAVLDHNLHNNNQKSTHLFDIDER